MKIFTSKEVCEILGVTNRGLQNWLYRGIYIYDHGKERRKLIPTIRADGPGTGYGFTYDDFDKFFNEVRKEHYKLGLEEMKTLTDNYIEEKPNKIIRSELNSKEYWLEKLSEATDLIQECIRQLRRWE